MGIIKFSYSCQQLHNIYGQYKFSSGNIRGTGYFEFSEGISTAAFREPLVTAKGNCYIDAEKLQRSCD